MKLRHLLTAAVLATAALTPFVVRADTVFGFYAGAGTWQQGYGGDVTSGLTEVDVENDLGLDDDERNVVLYAALEHPLPGLPNIRAQYMKMDTSGDNLLGRTIEFNGQSFTVAEAVNTQFDLTQTDVVFYYELLDNTISLDLGLAISLLEGEIAVQSTLASNSAEFDEVIPMLYAKARVDLPLTGLWLAAEGQGVSYDGNSLIEYNAHVGYETEIGFGIEVGYRGIALELDTFEDVQQAEIDISGPYAALNYHF
ncbi:MAG: outer membrane protein [Limisphaerales bacterium]|jgi:outer membrane protein